MDSDSRRLAGGGPRLGWVDGAGVGRVGFHTHRKADVLLLVRPGSEPALGAGLLVLPEDTGLVDPLEAVLLEPASDGMVSRRKRSAFARRV